MNENAPELVAVVKRDCPTCMLVAPLLAEMARTLPGFTVVSQDDPYFPEGVATIDDRDLERSWGLGIETVPTLVRLDGGRETARAIGWNRDEWRALTDVRDLGAELPENRPGCGALNVAPGMPERLALRFGALTIASREIEVPEDEDEIEVAYDRGWSDGLPIVPPTDLRVARMLAGTTRRPDEVIGHIPPDLAPCTVEKVAINAVMAGCRPEYLPVVLAAIEAALAPEFSMHGLLCTTYFSGPVIVVNGPVARRIGMNSGINALGQGNRANSTIGRAYQLVVRNVGGGVPGAIDRATLGNPGKVGFCFAEDESDDDWTPLSVARGFAPGTSAVTLFHGDGVTAFNDQKSRTPDELSRSLAMGLWGVCHPKLAGWGGALLVLSPEHHAIFSDAGWSRDDIQTALWEAMRRPGREIVAGAGGVGEGIDPARAEEIVDKFHPETFLIVRAGGRAGLVSGIIGGWTAQRRPDQVRPVSREIGT